MRYRRQSNTRYRITNETSSVSPTDTDDDKPFDPSSETDLTEPECRSRFRKTLRSGRSTNTDLQHVRAGSQKCAVPEPSKDRNVSAMDLVHQARYEDPADNTDEDLSKVPEDYGRSKHTKNLRFRLENRWARLVTICYLGAHLSILTDRFLLRYCRAKAIEPSADPKWEDAEDALCEALPNDMHRFLNWCLKLKRNPNGRWLKGYRKASSLDADWKYFRIYYTRITKHGMSKEMGEAVRTVYYLVLHAICIRI